MKSCLYDYKLIQFELHMQSFRRSRHNLATVRSVYTHLTKEIQTFCLRSVPARIFTPLRPVEYRLGLLLRMREITGKVIFWNNHGLDCLNL